MVFSSNIFQIRKVDSDIYLINPIMKPSVSRSVVTAFCKRAYVDRSLHRVCDKRISLSLLSLLSGFSASRLSRGGKRASHHPSMLAGAPQKVEKGTVNILKTKRFFLLSPYNDASDTAYVVIFFYSPMWQ